MDIVYFRSGSSTTFYKINEIDSTLSFINTPCWSPKVKTIGMKLIILSGVSNCGKTKTLNLLGSSLSDIEGITLKNKIVRGNPKQDDYDYFFDTRRNSKILISTWGDYPNLMKDNCTDYRDYDAIICACNIDFMRNRKHKPFEDAMKFDKYATIVLKVPENDTERQGDSNKEYSEYLLQLMKLRNII